MLPARSFLLAADPPTVQPTNASGRDALAVRTTTAQVQPLLDGVRGAGDWRELHPADTVRLVLDTRTLVPLAVRVEPATGDSRALWAARRGYRDPPGTAIFEVHLTAVRFTAADAAPAPATPDDAIVRHAGFRPHALSGREAPVPSWLPDGMRPHRAGSIRSGGPRVDLRSWTDGRAWMTLQVTSAWPGGRLFGMDGGAVRTIDLGANGTAYTSEDGTRVALHTADRDVVVSGSVAPAVLRRVTASLNLAGRAVPAGWADAASTPLASIRRDHPDALLPPPDLEGFGPPAATVSDGVVTLSYAGAGARGFVLTQTTGTRLTPPLHGDVRSVTVRGRTGRYTPTLGELEWVEAARVVSLRSRTQARDELLVIAQRLERP